MGELIREKNWSLTPLEAIPTWKPALKIAVCRVLDSHVASIVLWGDDLHQIYNDAYLPLLGPRHPVALGQPTAECWNEVWSFNEPIYKRVMGSGEVVHFEDQEFNIDPTGNYLLVANQDGDSVIVFRIDQATGKLEPTGSTIEVPTPVCVKFLPLAKS